MATLTIVLLANLATWASPALKEYLEIDYDSAGTPMQVTRRWQLDDDAVAKVRVLRNGAVYVMVVERHKRVGRFWFSLRADEVYVVEMPEDQVKMALKTTFATPAPEPAWKPLGEKQVAIAAVFRNPARRQSVSTCQTLGGLGSDFHMADRHG